MTAAEAAVARASQPRSFWSRLKFAAILLAILANMAYFGGNAAIDLWQAAGPGTSFTGTIVGHEDKVTGGENSDEYLLLKIDSNHGRLTFDVPDRTYNNTDVGQHVTGTLDARGIFGHDEALRTLYVNGVSDLDTDPTNRVLGQTLILLVVVGVGTLAISLMLRSRRPRRRRARPAATADPSGATG